ASICLSGDYTLSNFNFSHDGQGGTLITDPPTNGTTTNGLSTTTSTGASIDSSSAETSSDNAVTTTHTDSSSAVVTDNDGFQFASDTLPSKAEDNLAPQAQSPTVLVSQDGFHFAPSTLLPNDPAPQSQQDNIELDHSANAQ